jgi:predicted RNA-binding Zn-ribbon protein involved in translation (DUF1610 family)
LPKGDGPHILIYDLETSPILQWRWTAGRDDSRALKVDQDVRILTVAWTWLGEKTVHTASITNYPDDLELTELVWFLFDHADIVIAHNNDRFDEPVANTRFFAHGFGPPAPFQTIDTLKVARFKFKHYSNSLDALARLAGTELKKQTSGLQLWFRCMAGERAALREMLDYNKQDVVALKDLYLQMLPWIDRHPNVGHWQRGQFVCTNCGSQDLQKRGVHRTRVGIYQRYRCNNCGYHPRERRGTPQRSSSDRIQLT